MPPVAPKISNLIVAPYRSRPAPSTRPLVYACQPRLALWFTRVNEQPRKRAGVRKAPPGAVRERILAAAWEMVRAGRLSDLTMAAVARAAGVSRQTVYVGFGTRAGLLVQMVRERDAANPAASASPRRSQPGIPSRRWWRSRESSPAGGARSTPSRRRCTPRQSPTKQPGPPAGTAWRTCTSSAARSSDAWQRPAYSHPAGSPPSQATGSQPSSTRSAGCSLSRTPAGHRSSTRSARP